jgi:hypothetical protein
LARLVERYCRQVDPAGRSLGIFNPRRVRGGRSWSLHACGRALDWAPSSFDAGQRLNHLLVQAAGDHAIQLVIWNRQQWGGRAGPVFAPYRGTDPHTTHLHIEVRPS